MFTSEKNNNTIYKLQYSQQSVMKSNLSDQRFIYFFFLRIFAVITVIVRYEASYTEMGRLSEGYFMTICFVFVCVFFLCGGGGVYHLSLGVSFLHSLKRPSKGGHRIRLFSLLRPDTAIRFVVFDQTVEAQQGGQGIND